MCLIEGHSNLDGVMLCHGLVLMGLAFVGTVIAPAAVAVRFIHPAYAVVGYGRLAVIALSHCRLSRLSRPLRR